MRLVVIDSALVSAATCTRLMKERKDSSGAISQGCIKSLIFTGLLGGIAEDGVTSQKFINSH